MNLYVRMITNESKLTNPDTNICQVLYYEFLSPLIQRNKNVLHKKKPSLSSPRRPGKVVDAVPRDRGATATILWPPSKKKKKKTTTTTTTTPTTTTSPWQLLLLLPPQEEEEEEE